MREGAHVVGLERERAVPTPEHGHEQASTRMRPLEPFGIVDAVLDDDEVVALRFDFPSSERRLLVVYFSQRFIRGGRGVRVRGRLLDEVGREAHLASGLLRALPYLLLLAPGAAAGLGLARRRSSRLYRLAGAGLPRQMAWRRSSS